MDGSSKEGSWALVEFLAHGVESDEESQEEAGGVMRRRMRKKVKIWKRTIKRMESTMLNLSRERKGNPGASASVSPWVGGWRRHTI